MQTEVIIALVVLPLAFVLIILGVIRRFCRRKQFTETTSISNSENFQSGITKLHVSNDVENKKKMNTNYYVLQRELSMKPYFNWADHPSLVSEAVEHGWSRFAFAGQSISSASTRSKLLGLCVSGDHQVRESGAEISWDISLGSVEFMQKVRLNSGLKKKAILDTTLAASSVTQTALPLPGPFLGNSSFPQEAYFEITILSSRGEHDNRRVKLKKGEGDKIKLIQDVANHNLDAPVDEFRLSVKEEGGGNGAVAVSVGLSRGGSHPRRLPGSYFGSVGFNSDGSVYLDGIRLVLETQKEEWGNVDRVIGCGFDPNQKKVYFTVDSKLVHEINCKSDEFGRPLYPTLAANIDLTILVNFGQSSFKYAPANVHRTPNPCFIGTALGYEDSKEFFSMGRIDAEWLNRSTTRSNHSTIAGGSTKDIDEESETEDLFEIVLDRMNRSPSSFF